MLKDRYANPSNSISPFENLRPDIWRTIPTAQKTAIITHYKLDL